MAENIETNIGDKDSTKVIRFDWFIKRMLRDKSDYNVLEGLLTALLKQDITILRILESEGNQEAEDQKFNRVDLLAEDKNGKKIIIEIQNNRESDYLARILFGTSKVIIDYFTLGSDYKNISKVIHLSILYFNPGSGKDYIYYGTTELKGMNTGEVLTEKHLIDNTYQVKPNIFPEYYLINVERFPDVVKEDLDEWIYMLKNAEIKKEFKSKYIKEAGERLNMLQLSEEERHRYEKHLMNITSERNVMNTARAEGREEGREEETRDVIHDNLTEYDDYDDYGDDITNKLLEVKELSALRVLRKASQKSGSARQFLALLNDNV